MDRECCNCRYDSKEEWEQPCVDCRNSAGFMSDEYKNRPFLWEDASADAVNHPSHYNYGKYECIDVMVDTFGKEAVQHFCVLNAFKYVWRSEHKNGLEDIKKAWRYLDIYLQLEGKTNEQSN